MGKIRNTLLIAFLIFGILLGEAGAQTKPGENKPNTGNYPVWYFTNIDSAVSQTGARYDASLWISKTASYFVYYNGGSNDSVQVILMGSPFYSNTVGLPLNTTYTSAMYDIALDTIFVKSDTKYAGIATTLSSKAPFIYPKIVPYNSDGTTNDGDVTNDGTFEFTIWAEDNIVLPPKPSFQSK